MRREIQFLSFPILLLIIAVGSGPVPTQAQHAMAEVDNCLR